MTMEPESTPHHPPTQPPTVEPLPDALRLADGRHLVVTLGTPRAGHTDILEPPEGAPPGCVGRLVIGETLDPPARHAALFLMAFALQFNIFASSKAVPAALQLFCVLARSGCLAAVPPAVVATSADVERLTGQLWPEVTP